MSWIQTYHDGGVYARAPHGRGLRRPSIRSFRAIGDHAVEHRVHREVFSQSKKRGNGCSMENRGRKRSLLSPCGSRMGCRGTPKCEAEEQSRDEHVVLTPMQGWMLRMP